MSTLHERIACCIVGCHRGTRKWPPGSEIICGPHWRTVPRAARALHRATSKTLDEIEAKGAAEAAGAGLTSCTYTDFRLAREANSAAWSACRDAALRASAGL